PRRRGVPPRRVVVARGADHARPRPRDPRRGDAREDPVLARRPRRTHRRVRAAHRSAHAAPRGEEARRRGGAPDEGASPRCALGRRRAGRKTDEAAPLLMKEPHLDARAARDLVAYVAEEAATVGTVPSDRTIVVERVPDELGDLRICVMSPFGSRVHAPWAMAALTRLREARAGDIEAVWSDDGIVFRVPGGESPPPV